MRKLALILGSLVFITTARSQTIKLDSMLGLLSKSEQDTNALNLMGYLAYDYELYHPDSTYYFGREMLLLAGHLNIRNSEAEGLVFMSSGLMYMGNYPKALEYALQSLKISEQLSEQRTISNVFSLLASIYYNQKDAKNCLLYAWKCFNVNKDSNDSTNQTPYQLIAAGYDMRKSYDSCLFYLLKYYKIALRTNNAQAIAFTEENLADTYLELHKDSIALLKFRLALPYFEANQVSDGTCEAARSLAQIFERRGEADSAIWYGQLSLREAQSSLLSARQLEASDFLTGFYKKRNQPDSALKYMDLTITIKDSLFNKEKVQEMENLNFDETIRQQEIQTQKMKAHEVEVRNLQLLGIGIFIPIFFLFVLFLSRIKVKARIVEFLGIVSLLLFFEFITDLLYPYVSNWTNDSAIWEMLILVVLAALLEPINFRLEHWVKRKLVHRPLNMTKHE